jgi:hypothetical protein
MLTPMVDFDQRLIAPFAANPALFLTCKERSKLPVAS